MTDFCKKDCILLKKYRTIDDQLVATSGDMHLGNGNHFRISEISLKKYYLVYLNTGADLGGGCRGCAPPPSPEMSRARDECAPS